MSGVFTNLLIQVIAGAIGGNVAGGASKELSLGTAGNTIAGAIGGGVGGQLTDIALKARRKPTALTIHKPCSRRIVTTRTACGDLPFGYQAQLALPCRGCLSYPLLYAPARRGWRVQGQNPFWAGRGP